MKKLLLIVSTLIIGIFTINAQSSLMVTDVNNGMANVLDNSIISYTIASLDHITTEIDAKNITASTKYYKLRRFDDVLNSGSDAFFCIGGANCYTPATYTSPTTMTLTPNQTLASQSLSLLLELDEGTTSGYSSIRYQIYNINDVNDVFTFTLKYNQTVSVKEVSSLFSSVSSIYPNPAVNKAHINIVSSESVDNVMLSIINSLGSIVSTKSIDLSVGKNTISIDSENLSSGIYFATISSNKTKIVKKFTVNK
jgi:hypothetical protein